MYNARALDLLSVIFLCVCVCKFILQPGDRRWRKVASLMSGPVPVHSQNTSGSVNYKQNLSICARGSLAFYSYHLVCVSSRRLRFAFAIVTPSLLSAGTSTTFCWQSSLRINISDSAASMTSLSTSVHVLIASFLTLSNTVTHNSVPGLSLIHI